MLLFGCMFKLDFRDNILTKLNIFNSPELVANKQIITNTRKKKKNNTLNKY